MGTVLTLLWALVIIIILLICITIHEFGHFLSLKWLKIYVHEFSIGFGPSLFSWGKKETKYHIRAFPLGGYVIGASSLSDEFFENVKVDNNRKIDSLNLKHQILFAIAGISMNLLIALLFSLFYFAFAKHYKGGSYGAFLLQTIDQFFISIHNLFTGHSITISRAIKYDASKIGIYNLLPFLIFMFISMNINLAFFNVIPFPPLDGWRTVEFIYEKIKGRKIREKTRIVITLTGVFILVLFTIFSFVGPYLF